MKAIWKKSVVIALAGLLALSTAGCGDGNKKADGGKEADTKDTLKVAAASFADSLEPTVDYNGWQVVRYGIGETLVKFDKKMNATPWLAESWKISDDRLTWTFRINDKAMFSNGNKVTGDAAAKSLLRTLEKSPRAKRILPIVSVNGEGQNVLIRTARPVPVLPQLLGDPLFLIVDASVTDRDYEKKGPVGTGPYVVKNFTKDKCILERNEKYWNGTSWQTTACNFSITIDENGDAKQRATPEQIAALGAVDCFAVPILEQLQGSVEFAIVGASQNIVLQTLKLTYDIMDNGSVTADDNGDRIYTNEVNADFINELDEIEAKISSYNNDGACFSKVMLNGEYIEAHLYEGVTHRYVRPEEMLLRRIISQYEVPKVRLSQELRQNPALLPADIITDKTQPGQRFVQTGGEIDFANDTATVQMITFEE